MRSGQRGEYHYLQAEADSLTALFEVTIEFHIGLYVAITAFDGGPVTLGPEMRADGWDQFGQGPPFAIVTPELEIPRDEHDEWYLLEQRPPANWQPDRFVNYGGFTPVPVAELNLERDPTWDRRGLDYLIPLQERFWEIMEEYKPISYIATGDYDIVVSRRLEFINRLRTAGAAK